MCSVSWIGRFRLFGGGVGREVCFLVFCLSSHSHAYHLECALQSDRVVEGAVWSARAVVWRWAFVSAASCGVCIGEGMWKFDVMVALVWTGKG